MLISGILEELNFEKKDLDRFFIDTVSAFLILMIIINGLRIVIPTKIY
mgnify:CR=1 FL=1